MIFAPWLGAGRRELSAPQLRAAQRLRLGLHSLPVETGRFAEIDRQDRCCTFCDSGAVGDEAWQEMLLVPDRAAGQRLSRDIPSLSALLSCLVWWCRRACVSWCGEGTE